MNEKELRALSRLLVSKWTVSVGRCIAYYLRHSRRAKNCAVGIIDGTRDPPTSEDYQDTRDLFLRHNRQVYGVIAQCVPEWLVNTFYMSSPNIGRAALQHLRVEYGVNTSMDRGPCLLRWRNYIGATSIPGPGRPSTSITCAISMVACERPMLTFRTLGGSRFLMRRSLRCSMRMRRLLLLDARSKRWLGAADIASHGVG